jgi:hypothetical protein
MTILTVLFVGFVLGMRHATDADHLAAVATLVTRRSGWLQTMLQGVTWGVGHTLTLMVFGGVVLVLGQAIPPRLEQALELGVGVMLLLLGADVLRRLAVQRVHFHVHSHGPGQAHVHAHSHARAGTGDAARAPAGARHAELPHDHAHGVPWRALAVGTMHGLAGSAALVLLSLESMPSWPLGLAYIAVFGAGSIAGMALLSVAIAVPLRLSARRLGWLHHGMTAGLGAFSCALGAWLVYEIGFVERLLF